MNRILEKQLRYDMDRLKADFRLMSELVHLGLTEAVEALRESDRKKAYGVILRDSRIDSLESTIDRHCIEFLIKHIPAASHLRFVYSAAKMVSEVERVGDYAETIARQAIELSYSQKHPAVAILAEMSEIALKMFYQAIQAFLDSDVLLANQTVDLDRQVDDLEEEIYKQLTSENIQTSVHAKQIYSLLTIANRIERVADQSCNICEEVVYMMTGEVLKHHHEKEFTILFLCQENSCRSQMAEAIAKRLGHGRFHVYSAGVRPAKTLDQYFSDFLKKKGLLLSDQKPKSLEEVLPLDSYDVLVTLGDEAALRLPRIPFKTVALNWAIDDPAQAAPSGKDLMLENTYQVLETHIRDLLNALAH